MMTLPRTSAPAPNQKGFSLVEVLVALLVLSIGLLGLAALQTTSLQFNTGSYHRTQATFLAYDIIDRMRVNIGAVANSDGNGYDQPDSTDVSMSKDCDTDSCNSTELAIYDVRMWYERAINTLPGAAVAAPTIQVGTGNLVTVTISWVEQDMQKSQSWVVQL